MFPRQVWRESERTRETPVCPACKHNNTDVSIHQLDPGKACRDLEERLSRCHVEVSVRKSLKGWAEKSVWSLVCAMELGLITDSSSDAVPPDNGSLENRPPANGQPLGTILRSLKKPSRTVSGGAGRRRASKYASAVRTPSRGVAAKDSTVEKFWRSCKRKLGGSRKRPSRDFNRADRSSAMDDPARSPPRTAGEVCPASKRRRGRSESLPVRSNGFQQAGLIASSACARATRRSDRKSLREKNAARPTRNPTRRSGRRASASFVERVDRDRLEIRASFGEQLERALTEIRYRTENEEDEGNEGNEENEGNEGNEENEENPPVAGEFDSDDLSKQTAGHGSTDSIASRSAPPPATTRDDIRASPVVRQISNEGRPSSESERRNDRSSKNSNAPTEIARSAAKADANRAKMSRKDEGCHEVRRVTRGSTKIGKDLFVGKLVWGSCSGWWPALIIDADHVGMLPEAGRLWVYWIGEARISLLNEKTQIEPFSNSLNCRLTQNLNVARIRAIDATMQMLRKSLGCPLTKPYSVWVETNFSDINESLDEIKFYPYPPKIQQRLDCLKEMNAKVTEKYLIDQKKETQGRKVAEKTKESPQRNDEDLTRLPLREQKPGVIAWAKIAGHNWWPAMIIDYRDCCMGEPNFGCQWIMWYGDYKLSQVHHQLFLRFAKGVEKMQDYISNTKKHVYLVGVLQAAKDHCFRLGVDTEDWSLNDAFEYFSKNGDSQAIQSSPIKGESVKIYDKYSAHMVEKLNELKNDTDVDRKRVDDINQSDDLRLAINGESTFESLCLKCLKASTGRTEIHPFFEASLCKDCSEDYKPRMFVFGNDAKCFYCTVCGGSGTVIICDREDCPRVYCTACVKHLLCPTSYGEVLEQDPWECFLCRNNRPPRPDIRVKPRANWKEKIIDMFRTNCNPNVPQLAHNEERRKIRVLSLFDGLSTGLLVLRKLGLAVDVYYASEIDSDALMVSASHFGDRIVHLGNVKDITKEKIKEIAPIDLLIGGSPCNDLSLANPARLGLYDPNGTGILFFEYCRILKLLKKINNRRRLFWLYENVASMPTEYRLEINKHLGQEPDVIDSADFSPQHRLRLYWHNLPIEPHSLPFQDDQDVQDILTPHCQRYALVKKIRTVTTKVNSLKQGKLALKPILMKNESDSLWITELEEIFGFPRHYTDVKNLSATKRQRLIGKSWSVQTLSAILRSLCPFFHCNATETTSTSLS